MKDLTTRFHALVLLLLFFSASLFAQNKALDLSGSLNEVNVTYNLNTAGFTLEYWVYLPTLSSTTSLVNQTSTNLAAPLDMYVNPDGSINFWMGDGTATNQVLTSAGLITSSTWHHLAVVYDPASTGTEGKLYLNGNATPVVTINNSTLLNAGPIRIGRRADAFEGDDIFFDELRIWNTIRSGASIAEYFDQKLTGNEVGLEIYLPFEDNLNDKAGTGQNGSVVAGSIGYGTGPVLEENIGLNFNGTTGYVSGTGVNLANSDFTVEGWFNTDSPATVQSIFSSGSGGTNNQSLHINLQNTSILVGFFFDDVTIPYSVTSGWHHLAVTHSDATMETAVFVDGVLVGSDFHTSSFIGNSDFTIGRNVWDPSAYFDGILDEVRVWNTVRAIDQINFFKDRSLNGSEVGLLAYWNFEEGTGSTLTDLALIDGASNGTLNSMNTTLDWMAATNGLEEPFVVNSVSIVGLPGGPYPMTFQTTFGAWETIAEASSSNTFSYRVNNNASFDFGDNPGYDGIPDVGGNPIWINDDGLYVVNFGANAEWYGAEIINSLGILGDALPVGWTSDIDLIYQGSGVYTIDNLTFTTGEWKVRANDLWDRSWGDDPVADGILDQTGANISVTEGTYDVSIDLINRTYFLSANPPPAPTNLIAYRSAIDQIQLEWTDVVGETGYLIERASDYAFTAGIQTVDNVPANTTFYQHNIGTDQGYFYRITATNGAEDASSRSLVEFATTEAFPGYALTFDGSGDYATAGTGGAFNVTGSYTIEAWVNPASTAAMVIFSTRTSITDFGFDMQLAGGNTIHADIGNGVGWITTSADASYSYNTGEWIHVAYSVTSSGYTIYVNGSVVGSGSYSATPVLLDATHNFMTIGAENNAGGTFFNGAVDEVRVWNYAKTDFSDRNGPLLGNEAGLVAYYAFDENTGALSPTVDRSRNTLNGTLVGDANFIPSTAGDAALPPSLSNISFENIMDDAVDVRFDMDQTATLYYVVTQSSTIPSDGQIMSGQDEFGAPATTSGVYPNEISGNKVFTVGSLTALTNYYIYWVAEDPSLNLSNVLQGNFTTTDLPINITLTTLPVSGGSLVPGSTNNLIYKIQMDVSGGTATMIGFFLEPTGTFIPSDFSQFNFYQSIGIDDFGSASYIGSNTFFNSNPPAPDGSVGLYFSNAYSEETVYWYVTADIELAATEGATFSLNAPAIDQNFGITENNIQIDGGLQASSPFTIETIGITNPALNMTGGTEFVSINDSPSFDQDTDWTIEAWIKTPSTGQENIISQYNGSNGYAFFKIGATIYFQYFSGAAYQNGAASMAVTTGIDDNNWHHVAISQSGTNGKMYVDGSLVFDFNGMLSLDEPTADIRFGNNAGIGAFTGSIDEVRFWNYQRTDQEIIDNYNAQMAGSEPGLVAYYSFIEAGGLSVGDYTSNGNTGSLFNGPTWVEGPTLFPSGGSAPQILNFGIIDLTSNSATVRVNVDISSILYYVVTTSSSAPSETQVQNGQDDTGSPALISGNIPVTGGFNDFGVGSLDPETSYFVYALAENGGQFSNVAGVDFVTLGDPVITVNSPNGGENIEQNSIYQISWNSNDFVGDPLLVLEYSDDGGVNDWFQIASDYASNLTGKYFWFVDEGIHAISSNYKIRVRTDDNSVSDESDNVFNVTASGAPALTLLFPNGGEQFERGKSIEINYTASGFSGSDEIFFDYSSDGGSGWQPFGSTILANNPGTYYLYLDPLVVPVSANYMIRIRNTDTSVSDQSDAVFTVISEPPPSIEISNPSVGQQVEQNSIIPINLNLLNFFDYEQTIIIEVSSNNGSSWSELTQRPVETLFNGYNWLVANASYSVGSDYLIRARTLDNSIVGTMSGTFEVISPFSSPNIFFQNPSGPSVYYRGDTETIRFVTTGISATNQIEIAWSTDDVTYTPIVQDALNNIPGEYNWMIDEVYPENTNYTLRISDLGGTGAQETSSTFEIVVPSKITVTSQPVSGGTVVQGETERLIYQFSAQIEDKDLITEGIFLNFDGDIQPTDLDAIGLWVNTVDDFASASLYALAEYPNVSIPELEGNGFLWLFSEFYTAGTTLFYYVTVDVASDASEGVSFNVTQPNDENFGFGDNSNIIVNAQSGNSFTIGAATPEITVIAPNGGELLNVGDFYEINWTHSGFSGSDQIEIQWSDNGGASFLNIGVGTFDNYNGTFNWEVPNFVGTNNLIRIVNTTTSVSDQSNSPFTIQLPAVNAPTIQASNVDFPQVGIDFVEVSWAIGDGAERIVFMSEGSPSFPLPVNNVSYAANSTFGSGDIVGTSWFAVYSGSGTSTTVSALDPQTTYSVAVVEFNTDGMSQVTYLTTPGSQNPNSTETLPLPNVSLHFDGVDDYVEIPNNSFLDLGNTFSIEAYVKSGGANSGSRAIIDKRNAGTNNSNFSLSVVNGMDLGIYINNGTTNFSQVVPDVLQVGTWALLTVTYNGSNVRVYVNGIEHAVFPLTMTYVNQAVPIQIGRAATNSEFFNGEIDEVRIWTNVLTPANIGSNTTKELNGNEFGLVAYYKFNDGIPGSNNTAITSVNNFAAATSAQPIDGLLNGFAKVAGTSNFVESTAFEISITSPAIQASFVSPTNTTTNSFDITWTNGDGVKRIVAMKSGSSLTMADLINGTYYTADSRFGGGDQTAGGWYIVYNGIGNSMTVTGLSPNTTYTIAVMEANGPAGAEMYQLANGTSNPNSFATSQITPNVVITTIPVAGANIRQGKSDVLVYKFKMEVTAAPIDLASLALNFTGSATNTEFVNGGLKLFASVTGDNIINFKTAIPVATSSYNSGAPLWFVNRNYPAGTTIHFYVTSSSDFGATATRTFSVSIPIAGNFSYSSSPTPNMNFTGAGSGNTFIIEQTPSVTLTSEIDATVMRKRIVPNSTNNWVYKYNLVIDRDVRVTKVRVPFDGPLTTADVSANGAKLWVNTNPGITTPPTGSPIATASVGVSEIVFDIPTNDQLFSGANTIQFWVSLDVAASARLDNTFQGVGTSNDFTFNDIVLLFDSPSIGQKATVTAADTYCDPAENPISTTVGPLITNFTMPGISNSPQGEQDYHMFYLFNSAGVLSNTNPNVSITSSGNGFIKMWIDWDKNNSFNETTELVVNNVPISASVPLNTTINVPASVSAGNTRIRVYVYETNEWINGGCDPLNGGITTAEGQIHDYGISIVEPNGATQTLAASNVGYFNFTANWIAMPGANFYRLDVAEDAAFTKLLVNNEGVTTNSYTLNTNLKYDKPYYYRVRVAYPSSTTGNSNITSLRTQRDPLTAQDSVALVLLHQTNGGSEWTNATNWRQPGKRLETWGGVTMTGTRVTGLNMEGFGMTGDLPAQFSNSGALQMMNNWNLASNDLTGIQVVGGLSALTNLNVVENKLVFEDLWDYIGAFDTFNYSPQQELGEATEVVIPRGSNYTVNFIQQQAETYQWKRNGIDIPSATSTNYLIEDIKYESMGDFVLDMSDSSVPGLTLSSAPQTVLASGGITLNVSNLIGLPLDEGTGYLLKIEQPGEPFDTTQVVNFTDGYLFFDITILGDYIISVHSDPSIYLPTYYAQTFLWEEADTLFFRNVALQANMVMTSIPGALDPLDQGLISGFFDIEDPNIPDARVDGRRRGSNVRCHIRRNTGGGRTEADNYVLIASVETDENGQFNIANLPPGLYRINFEYPGVPMDQNSFVEFEVTADGDNSEINLSALAENGLISVEQILPTAVSNMLEEMKVYPVPASNVLHIEFKDLKVNVTASLWNMEGRNVKEAMLVKSSAGNHDLDLSDLSGGLYILNLVDASTGKLLTSFKVLIRK